MNHVLAATRIDFGQLSPIAFERLVADLLDRLGFEVAAAEGAIDTGVDLKATRQVIDPFGVPEGRHRTALVHRNSRWKSRRWCNEGRRPHVTAVFFPTENFPVRILGYVELETPPGWAWSAGQRRIRAHPDGTTTCLTPCSARRRRRPPPGCFRFPGHPGTPRTSPTSRGVGRPPRTSRDARPFHAGAVQEPQRPSVTPGPGAAP